MGKGMALERMVINFGSSAGHSELGVEVLFHTYNESKFKTSVVSPTSLTFSQEEKRSCVVGEEKRQQKVK